MKTSAGRVLLLPRSEYNPDTSYTMLDMVRDDFCLFVCKKDVRGVKPSEDTSEEYWMRCTDKVESYTEDDVQNTFDYVFENSSSGEDVGVDATV